MYMKTAVINFKVDPKLKAAAQARANKMGISQSIVLNDRLKEFAAGKPMSIDFPEEEMTPHLEKLIKESEASGTVGPFNTIEDAIAFLKIHHNDN